MSLWYVFRSKMFINEAVRVSYIGKHPDYLGFVSCHLAVSSHCLSFFRMRHSSGIFWSERFASWLRFACIQGCNAAWKAQRWTTCALWELSSDNKWSLLFQFSYYCSKIQGLFLMSLKCLNYEEHLKWDSSQTCVHMNSGHWHYFSLLLLHYMLIFLKWHNRHGFTESKLD